jgi:hypothetical protein
LKRWLLAIRGWTCEIGKERDVGGPKKWSDVDCSFCGKSQKQVEKVIAGPGGVYICNECVDLCRDILDGTPGAQSTGQASESVATGASPQHERVIRQDRRQLLSARLRALENLSEINEAVRACRDRQEAVDALVAEPFSFSGLEAQIILDMGIGQQTAAALSRLRREIADLGDSP